MVKNPLTTEISVLDHGHIQLLDVMGSDRSIEAAARVSYGGGTRKVTQTRGLIRYLMSHRHTSPFEMAEMQFKVKCPIFVARQWVRHRTANLNEVSGRYSEMPEEYWRPDEWRGQDNKNKQGSDGLVDYRPWDDYGEAEANAFTEYRRRLEGGVSREMARSCLPLSTYTEFVWKCDLHNILHFLSLRLDSHAQPEIRVYAEQMAEWVKDYFPLTWEAFVDFRLEAITFSGPECKVLRRVMDRIAQGHPFEDKDVEQFSDREWGDFMGKLDRVWPS